MTVGCWMFRADHAIRTLSSPRSAMEAGLKTIAHKNSPNVQGRRSSSWAPSIGARKALTTQTQRCHLAERGSCDMLRRPQESGCGHGRQVSAWGEQAVRSVWKRATCRNPANNRWGCASRSFAMARGATSNLEVSVRDLAIEAGAGIPYSYHCGSRRTGKVRTIS